MPEPAVPEAMTDTNRRAYLAVGAHMAREEARNYIRRCENLIGHHAATVTADMLGARCTTTPAPDGNGLLITVTTSDGDTSSRVLSFVPTPPDHPDG